MEKAFKMYQAFISYNEMVKWEANNIPLLFGFVFKAPNYYIPDTKLAKTLERILDQKRAGGQTDEFETV